MKNDNIINRNEEKIENKAYLERNRETISSGEVISVMFSGVGGQGIILASTVLAGAAMTEGLDVKVSEVHGMAQRGGSVVGSVRFGKKVYSPIIDRADVLTFRVPLTKVADYNRPALFIITHRPIRARFNAPTAAITFLLLHPDHSSLLVLAQHV